MEIGIPPQEWPPSPLGGTPAFFLELSDNASHGIDRPTQRDYGLCPNLDLSLVRNYPDILNHASHCTQTFRAGFLCSLTVLPYLALAGGLLVFLFKEKHGTARLYGGSPRTPLLALTGFHWCSQQHPPGSSPRHSMLYNLTGQPAILLAPPAGPFFWFTLGMNFLYVLLVHWMLLTASGRFHNGHQLYGATWTHSLPLRVWTLQRQAGRLGHPYV